LRPLVQPWISELIPSGRKQKSIAGDAKCVVDITAWTFIDRRGEEEGAREYPNKARELTRRYLMGVVTNIEKRKSNRQR